MFDPLLAVVRANPLLVPMAFVVVVIAGSLVVSLYVQDRQNRADALQRELARLQRERDRMGRL